MATDQTLVLPTGGTAGSQDEGFRRGSRTLRTVKFDRTVTENTPSADVPQPTRHSVPPAQPMTSAAPRPVHLLTTMGSHHAGDVIYVTQNASVNDQQKGITLVPVNTVTSAQRANSNTPTGTFSQQEVVLLEKGVPLQRLAPVAHAAKGNAGPVPGMEAVMVKPVHPQKNAAAKVVYLRPIHAHNTHQTQGELHRRNTSPTVIKENTNNKSFVQGSRPQNAIHSPVLYYLAKDGQGREVLISKGHDMGVIDGKGTNVQRITTPVQMIKSSNVGQTINRNDVILKSSDEPVLTYLVASNENAVHQQTNTHMAVPRGVHLSSDTKQPPKYQSLKKQPGNYMVIDNKFIPIKIVSNSNVKTDNLDTLKRLNKEVHVRQHVQDTVRKPTAHNIARKQQTQPIAKNHLNSDDVVYSERAKLDMVRQWTQNGHYGQTVPPITVAKNRHANTKQNKAARHQEEFMEEAYWKHGLVTHHYESNPMNLYGELSREKMMKSNRNVHRSEDDLDMYWKQRLVKSANDVYAQADHMYSKADLYKNYLSYPAATRRQTRKHDGIKLEQYHFSQLESQQYSSKDYERQRREVLYRKMKNKLEMDEVEKRNAANELRKKEFNLHNDYWHKWGQNTYSPGGMHDKSRSVNEKRAKTYTHGTGEKYKNHLVYPVDKNRYRSEILPENNNKKPRQGGGVSSPNHVVYDQSNKRERRREDMAKAESIQKKSAVGSHDAMKKGKRSEMNRLKDEYNNARQKQRQRQQDGGKHREKNGTAVTVSREGMFGEFTMHKKDSQRHWSSPNGATTNGAKRTGGRAGESSSSSSSSASSEYKEVEEEEAVNAETACTAL